MLMLENTVTPSPMQWRSIIMGARNPMDSWARSDSDFSGPEFVMGPNDHELLMKLAAAGSDHRKYVRMIVVYVDITAPLYWWKEFDTYKVGTVTNSCSTMHTIHKRPLVRTDFSCERLIGRESEDDVFRIHCESSDTGVDEFDAEDVFDLTIMAVNHYRNLFLKTGNKRYWEKMIQLLPTSFNQRRTVELNYENLRNIYHARRNHKLDEWHVLCDWIDTLPYPELIRG